MSVILPGKLSVLCNTVQTIFFLQYLSKTAWISVENIERLTIFYKFILWPYRIADESQQRLRGC